MLRGPIRFTNALAGTVDFIYPGPATDMQSPASAGAVNGSTYVYYAQSLDMSEWEIGSGVYTSGSATFARTTITANHLGTTAKVNFTNSPQVLVLDTAAAFTTASDIAANFTASQCKFVFVDSTHCKLIPFGGSKIKIAGALYDIPSAGIAITNAGLVASTVYYVYALQTAGVVSLEFSTTAHATDTTSGNVGVEIKNGDATRSLVGMVYANSSSQFADDEQHRLVRSWFNEPGISFYNFSSATVSTSAVSFIELDATVRVQVLLWVLEQTSMTFSAMATNSSAGATTYTSYWIDGAFNGLYGFMHVPFANYYECTAVPWGTQLGEGLHTLSIGGQVGSGTSTWTNKIIGGATVRR